MKIPVFLVLPALTGLLKSYGGVFSFHSLSWTHCSNKRRKYVGTATRSLAAGFEDWKKGASVFEATSQASSQTPQSPIPIMPSQLFQELAFSQLELLASSMPSDDSEASGSKIKSIALYAPQENSNTGQLEFTPVVLYPHPTSDRVFIANDSDSGMAPLMPKTLTKLPGFAHATSLLPGYPMVSMTDSGEAGIGIVEEVLCDLKMGGTALSVPLFAGSQTVGVLLVTPSFSSKNGEKSSNVWTERDRQQIAKAAKSLSLALTLDSERNQLQENNQRAQDALSDSLHQIKNPLQALRTYGKLLQRRIADPEEPESGRVSPPQLLELAEHLMVQSDRLVERLKPVDAIVDSLGDIKRPPALNPAKPDSRALVPYWMTPSIPWEEDALDFARDMPYRNPEQRQSRMERSSGETNSTIEVSFFDTMPASPMFSGIDLEMAFVSDVLEPIFEVFRAIAADKGIAFSIEESEELPGVLVCPLALQEAVTNILDNAFRYVMLAAGSSLNFEPRVRVRMLPNQSTVAPGVTILVEDNGLGIASNYREAVFERGVRSPSVQSLNGKGIGLDIARSLTKAMGGSLRIVENNKYPQCLSGAVFELVVFRNH